VVSGDQYEAPVPVRGGGGGGGSSAQLPTSLPKKKTAELAGGGGGVVVEDDLYGDDAWVPVPATALDEAQTLPWFHGECSRVDAERRLLKTDTVGAALLRASKRNTVLTVLLATGSPPMFIHHVLSLASDGSGKLLVDDKPAPAQVASVLQLLVALREPTPLIRIGLTTLLPASGSSGSSSSSGSGGASGRPALWPVWLHYSASAAEAEASVRAGGRDGAFLLRPGPANGSFLLTAAFGAQVVHRLLDFPSAHGCTMDGAPLAPFATLPAALLYLRRTAVAAMPGRLAAPVPP
jgi:hypothetical protein